MAMQSMVLKFGGVTTAFCPRLPMSNTIITQMHGIQVKVVKVSKHYNYPLLRKVAHSCVYILVVVLDYMCRLKLGPYMIV